MKTKHRILKKEADIKNWLDEMGIGNYTINKDLTVDVKEDVRLFNKDFTRLPIQFGTVSGTFYFWDCKNLKILRGTPKEVGKSFYCHGCGNKFTEIDVLKVCNVNGDVFV